MIIGLLIVMFIILALVATLVDKIGELKAKVEEERLYNNKVNDMNMDIFRKLHETNVIQFKQIKANDEITKHILKSLVEDIEKIEKHNVDIDLQVESIVALNDLDVLEEKIKSCSIDGKCE